MDRGSSGRVGHLAARLAGSHVGSWRRGHRQLEVVGGRAKAWLDYPLTPGDRHERASGPRVLLPVLAACCRPGRALQPASRPPGSPALDYRCVRTFRSAGTIRGLEENVLIDPVMEILRAGQ